ncbi:hypothetical protein LTR37_018057 [Vermiconidia calcicola]|uniref:Uncharacterized protein n=1 Tax=Vermiconidia calcicola TaxID=1690605 RepID=A0ACC3MJY3_9PEZI|nr:hypothetical protein LTR37_018057 [Vermiconidia calcicola]
MLSLRRYAVYLGLAACFLLGTLNYFREPLISRAPFKQQRPLQQPQVEDGEPTTISTDLSDPKFRWDQVPVRYPVKKLAALPTQAPKRLPKVQHDFKPETEQQSSTRKTRLNAVKESFTRCWNSYRKLAWLKDELAPLSGGFRDGFGGWAANLVDNLDNLWIMGMREEFEEAVQAVEKIDLTQCTLEQINVFETTIRHLGGLLSAYDLSGDERLLVKAKEVGSMLIVAFDTPNRMPITRWLWRQALEGPQVADDTVLVAEIGSLSMEFTRLSMLTGDPKWYDAVERIVKILDKQQGKTLLPGMFPVTVNAKTADFTHDTMFTLSAMSDSLYEYIPKMHALLGGVDPRYEKLYKGSTATAIEYNLWRPMTPDNADILISGEVRSHGKFVPPTLDPQGQHLVCFAGGMFALGGKLFNTPAHVEIGKKLVDGCIWTYKNMPLGIMPEVFRMVPCDSRLECAWNETAWKAGVRAEQHTLTEDDTEDVDAIIATQRLQKGFTNLQDRRYILRPEAIESVFLLYRMTGAQYLQEAAWELFTAITNATETPLANAALSDVSFSPEQMRAEERMVQMDSMESFWMAETLKYFYLVFSEPEVVSLDEWVFNTEAHPFRRRVPE